MGIRIAEIVLQSGESISISGGVTALVGPSNAGKSLILRETVDAVTSGSFSLPQRRAVERVNLEFTGSAKDFFARLARSYSLQNAGTYSYGRYETPHVFVNGIPISDVQLEQAWNGIANLGSVANAVVHLLDAGSRLSLVADGGIWDPYTAAPANPIQRLYSSRELEQKLSTLLKQAFNEELTVHRYSGTQISLRMGKVSAEEVPPPATREYLEEINALPHWGEQGDGMKSFLGIALALFTADYPIILIDEPEAFLHPPQAYLLGRVLAELGNPETQVIVATHSADVLDGLTSVSAGKSELSIARITRQSKDNHVAQVGRDVLRELYDDPLIKYYNILDGLFANGAILCEADSDCTYYKAVLGTIDSLSDGRATNSVSIHFTHCGGKARLPKAVRALRSANVTVACAVDFDLLRDDKDFDDLVSAFGGDTSLLKGWRNTLIDAVSKKSEKPNRVVAKALIGDVLEKAGSQYLSSGDVARILEAVSVKSGWKEAKLHGRGLLSGDQVTAFDNLNRALRELGIFLVEKGELERFHPEVPQDNKAAWLRQVLEEGKFERSPDGRAFVAAMVEHILVHQ